MNKWSDQEKGTLKILYTQGMTIRDIASKLGRSFTSVKFKVGELGLRRSRVQREQTVLTSTESPLIVDYKEIAEIMRTNLFRKHPYVNHWRGQIDEEAVLVLSDIHCGTVNEIYDAQAGGKLVTYNEAIRQKAQIYLRDSIFQITELLSASYKIKTLHILILGDIITNDRIFAGQNWEIDRPVGIQMWAMVRDLSQFIEELKTKFEHIKVVGVVGNHGRSSEQYREEPVENNFEYHVYKILERTFEKDSQVEITVPNTRFYSIKIKGHTYYMSHGDSFKGSTRNSIDRAARELLTALIPDLPQGFDVYLMGHFHKAEKMDLNEKSTLLINGCWIPRDQFGFKIFRQYSKPGQWLFGVGKSRSITWSFNLDFGNPSTTR